MRQIFLLLCLFVIHTSFSQQSITEDTYEYLYSEALVHYQANQFEIGLDKFNAYIEQGGSYAQEATFYHSMCQLKLGKEQGEEALTNFVNGNPNHPLASRAYFSLANYYFDQENIDQAFRYYQLADHASLTRSEKHEFFFKRGYCLFLQGKFEDAQLDLRNSLSYGEAYKDAASYYLGYTYFNQEKFPEALKYFEEVKKDGAYGDAKLEVMAGIYFERKDDQKLISLANEIYGEASTKSQKTLNRMLGETYFDQKKYNQAIRYFKAYLDISDNRMDEEGYYKLAYAYFKTQNDEEAIKYFKLAALGDGALVQVSSFYLGQLYLRNKNIEYAIRSFEKASSGKDKSIAEEASFLTGKVTYQRNQFSECINHFQQFLKDYPSSKFRQEVNQLMAQAYLKTSNYDQAISYLETLPTKSESLKRAYQNATFHKGQLLFNDQRFSEAIPVLKKSTSVPLDKEMASKGYYLLGECYSLNNQLSEAVRAYQQCKSLSNTSSIWNINSDYGLAYIYYNDKKYQEAAQYFLSFTNRSGKYHRFYLDARMRLADCRYVLKQYSEAIRIYDQLTREPTVPLDYLLFQLGLTYQLNSQSKEARNTFERVYNYNGETPYRDNALFQMGLSCLEDNLFKEAISYFDKFERDLRQSALMPYVRAKRALCYFNIDQYTPAANDYKYLLSNHISHPVANDALLGLQELRKKGLSIPEFDRYMEAFQRANPEDSSLEVISFEAAKTNYFNQEYQKAIEALRKFQEKYPRSSFSEDVLYFLGDSYYRMEDWNRATDVFTQLAKNTSSGYLSRVLDKRGRAYLRMNEYQQAIYNYDLLHANGVNRKDQYLADEGKMLGFFHLNNHDSALFYANKIINGDWKPVGAESQALLLKGKVFLSRKDFENARKTIQKVLEETKSEIAAESKYVIALSHYQEGSYKTSVETLFELNEEFSSYDYWIGKSFILIADNYMKMNELFQAKATLTSIIEKSPVEEIVREANTRLDKLEKESAKLLENDTTNAE